MALDRFSLGLRRRTHLLALMFVISLVTAGVFTNLISYRHHRQWDLTRQQQFTLTPRTQLALTSISRPIKITTLFVPQTKRRQGEGRLVQELSDRVHELLGLFGQHTGKLTVERLDWVAHKVKVEKLVGRFRGKDLEDSVIFEMGDNRIFVKGWELARFDRRRTRIAQWRAEEVLASAILRVTDQRRHKIYVYPGRRSVTRGLSAFRAMLAPENITCHPLTPERPIPADCDMLLLVPRADLSAESAGHLADYLDSGGRLLMVISPQQLKLPLLDGVLRRSGIEIDYNVVMHEKHWRLILGSDRVSKQHPITASVVEEDRAILEYCMSLREVQRARPGQQYHALSATPAGPRWEDVRLSARQRPLKARGPYQLAAAVAWPAPPRNNKIPIGRLVVFGSQSMLDDQLLERKGVSNYTLTYNSVQWLLDRESRIVTRANATRPSGEVLLSEKQKQTLGLSLAMMMMSAFFMGIMVWLFRKD